MVRLTKQMLSIRNIVGALVVTSMVLGCQPSPIQKPTPQSAPSPTPAMSQPVQHGAPQATFTQPPPAALSPQQPTTIPVNPNGDQSTSYPASGSQTEAPSPSPGNTSEEGEISRAALSVIDDWQAKSWKPSRGTNWRKMDRYSITSSPEAVAEISFEWAATTDEDGKVVTATVCRSKVALRKYNTGWAPESYQGPSGINYMN